MLAPAFRRLALYLSSRLAPATLPSGAATRSVLFLPEHASETTASRSSVPAYAPGFFLWHLLSTPESFNGLGTQRIRHHPTNALPGQQEMLRDSEFRDCLAVGVFEVALQLGNGVYETPRDVAQSTCWCKHFLPLANRLAGISDVHRYPRFANKSTTRKAGIVFGEPFVRCADKQRSAVCGFAMGAILIFRATGIEQRGGAHRVIVAQQFERMSLSPASRTDASPTPSFLAGGGNMGAIFRAHDWAATSLGPCESWSQALKALTGIVLTSVQPMFIAWGPERLLLYNDAYAPMLAARHPGALGLPFFVVWPEVEAEIGRMFDQVFAGMPVNMDDITLYLNRPGRPLEAHFAFSYSPVHSETETVEGLFCVCSETTDQVLALRREEHVAFQSRLAETLRPLADAIEVQAEASRLLGQYLEANRVVYFEIQDDDYVIERDFVEGVQTLAGRYPVASFGTELLENLLAGRTVAEPDATIEVNRSEAARASFEAIKVRGHVDVPLVKDGRFVAGMTVHVSERRDWSPEDIALIEDTAERTWAAIERVRAEAALQVSEERSAFVRRSSGVGFWYCDLPFDVLQWDELVKHHFHLPPDAVVTIQRFYDVIHPDDREPTRLAIETSIEGRTHYNTEYRTVHPTTGAIKWVRAIGRTFYQADGTPIRFDGVTLDVSEQKLAEINMREADLHKDQFLATLAHELRNPLAPLRNGLQILRIGSGDQAVIGRAREMMERQVDIMVRLVDDLLDVARISGGKIELRRHVESLQTVVARAVETAMPAIEAHRHSLTVKAPAEPIMVDVDSARFIQVLTNLIGNAAKYTPPGGHLTVEAMIDGSEAVTSVTDNGVGIPYAALDRVFDMFSQVGSTRSMAQGGLGIGLYLAKRIVELHDGRLLAHSDGTGKGSTFSVRVPLAQVALEAGQRSESETRSSQRSKHLRILIVDDNLDAGDSLALRLSLEGHQVRVARDGPSGLRIAREFQPRVAFLDIGMPGMDGYELAAAIRASELRHPLALVALTGWGSEADIERASKAGFDRHLTKPASSEDIESVFSEIEL